MDARSERELRFEELVRAVAVPLRRYVVRRAGRDDADDVLADAMLVLWRRLDDLPEGDPLPWCYGVARGCLANAARADTRRRRLLARLATIRPEVPTAAEPGEAEDAVRVAVAGLPELDRELVRLWAWEELGPAEIAVVVGMSANAVSVRLHRARARLAATLDPGRAHREG